MPPPYGVDTQTSRLDRIPWPAFVAWNGGAGPVFAGRNFLGGDFIWSSPEATTALANPSPSNATFLETTTDFIAPFQGKDSTRQKVTGDLGRLYGQIDGTALCARIAATMNTTELTAGDSNIVYVYLEIDPAAAFSVDYWAGWSHAVYNANANADGTPHRPFMPCIRCTFTLSNGKLLIDPNVTATVKAAPGQHKELKVSCWGFWADAPDLFPAMQKTGTDVDWTVFAPTPVTVWLWRFSTRLLNAGGDPMNRSVMDLAVDAAYTAGTPSRSATDYMLKTGKWQPTENVVSRGFSFGYPLSAADIAVISHARLDDESRFESACNSRTHVAGGFMTVLGLYARPPTTTKSMSDTSSMNTTAVSAVRNTTLNLFTVFEQPVGATVDTYYDRAAHNGTTDATNALTYVAETLFQPPHSTVFFAFDWSPSGSVSGDTTEPATPDELTVADNDRITSYIADVVAAYRQYLTTHPNRPYRIGFYGAGVELRVAYDNPGISGFWQSSSACRASNAPPNWPWPHATRWQPFPSPPFQPKIGGHIGEDLDYDWGDGGDWYPPTPLNVELTQIEVNATPALTHAAQKVFGNLITPPQP